MADGKNGSGFCALDAGARAREGVCSAARHSQSLNKGSLPNTHYERFAVNQ